MSSSYYSFETNHPTSYGKRPVLHTPHGSAGNGASHDTTTSTHQSTGAPTSTSRLQHNTPKDYRTSGHGGTGNTYYSSSEWAIFSFDEELERQLKREKEAAPIFYVGRGGAGNTVHPGQYSFTRKRSDTSSIASNSTLDSEGEDKTRRNIGKGWGKIMGVTS
ncbi:hypothetical protein FQN54_000486 [Arachnomyces sp. PD_36]|nr:hypothetical protein FQN54_000486 [Arachnomyces sp. PD_36]